MLKQNILTTDPHSPQHQIQEGEQRVRGLELEARYRVWTGGSVIGSYTFNDAEITRSNNGDQGKTPSLRPKHQASIWIDQVIQTGSLKGLGIGLGARYRGDSYASNNNKIINPAYTLLDAALWYSHQQWTARLNVSNLADKEYASNLGWGYQPGSRRTVNLDVSYKF